MNIFEGFIRRPVATIMLNAALVVFGLLGLQRLPVRELPDVDPPVVNVLTVYPGASAEVVETEVTERLEEAISSTEGIKLLTSESREQVSSISIEFVRERDIDVAAQDVRDRVSRVRGYMPEDVEDPVITKQDASAQPIIWIAFFSDRYDTRELSQYADDLVKDRLQTVPGVSSVIIGGEKKLAMRIWLDAERMAARGVTVIDVERALRAQNVELPSGRVENVDREMTVRTMGQLHTPEEFDGLILRQDGTRVVKLGDVARVEQGVEDLRGVARYNSKPSVGLGVVRQSKANTLTVASLVKERMAEIAPSLPPGIEYDFPYDESLYVEAAVVEVWQTLAVAFVLVVLVIFVFLRDVRSTLIPSIAIPVSITATFGVLYLFGYSINIFTLLALVLAIGIVVDDAVVVLENVFRHVEEGMKPIPAAVLAMKEIAFAVVTTTLSLIAVFLPLTFIGGLTGRLLLEFAVSLATAVAVSSTVALTLTPMAASRILKPVDPSSHGKLFNAFERFFVRVNRRYERALGWALSHRVLMVLIAGVSMALAYHFYRQLDQDFLPEEDKSRMLVLCLTPEGSTPEYTDRMLQKAEKVLSETPEVKSYFSAAAMPFDGPGDPTLGIAFVRLVDGERRHIRDVVGGPTGVGGRFMGEIEGAMTFPIMPKAVDLTFGQPFSLVLSHPDLTRLNELAEEWAGKLMQSGYLANVRPSFSITKPEMRVGVDRERAGVLGVSVRDVSRTLQVLFGGQDLSDIKLGGKQYEVIAQLDRTSRLKPSDLERLYVRNERGELVQLSNVVLWSTGAGPNTIERFQRNRSATIEATPVGVTLGTAVERTEAMLRAELPGDVRFDWKGDARNLRESSRDLYFFMLLAIVVVYMVLAAQFESFMHPFTVLLALPLAFLGAFFLLYLLSWVNWVGNAMYGMANFMPDPPGWSVFLAGVVPRISSMNMNIFSQVGLILLIGLVSKNSILLVEFANQQMAKGAKARDAMLAAGKIRLRPILMTSFSTVAGILPIAIGFGQAAESRRPLGVVAVGGLVTSTLLTLFVIPVIYTLFADLSLKLIGRPAGVHRQPGEDGVGGSPMDAARVEQPAGNPKSEERNPKSSEGRERA